jgi:hypothetical protein
MDKQIYFLRQSIKGKIADMIFERIMKQDPNHTYTVLPFGYENTMPELAQYQDRIKQQTVLSAIRRSPDFVLINDKDKSEAIFVEVKYRRYLNHETILKWAKLIHDSWPDTYLFLATQDGFYFDSCKIIMEQKGNMKLLDQEIISLETQKKYLDVLKEFIRTEN